nr:hypothetical protein [Mammaliicoccus sciuri]
MIDTVENLNLNMNDILSFIVIISLFIIYTLHYKYNLTEDLQNSTGFKSEKRILGYKNILLKRYFFRHQRLY